MDGKKARKCQDNIDIAASRSEYECNFVKTKVI